MENKLHTSIFAGLCLLIFLAPWQIYFSLGTSITLSLAQVLAVFVFLLWVFYDAKYGRTRKVTDQQSWPALLILAMIFSLTVALDYKLSFKYLLKWTVPILLFFVTARTVKDLAQVKILLKTAVWSATAMILLGWLEFFAGFNYIFDFVSKQRAFVGVFTGPGPLRVALSENMFLNKMNWFYWLPDIWQYWVRPFGTFIAVSAFTLFTGLAFVFIPVLYQESKGKIFPRVYLFAGFMFAGAIILTFARSGWLSLIAVLVLYFTVANKKRSLSYILLATMIGILLAGILPSNFSLVFKNRIASLVQESSVQSRLVVWKQAFKIIVQRPVTGVGLANFDYGLEAFNTPPYLVVPAHNNYLQIWAETGILGLAALLMVILQGLRVSYRTYKSRDNSISNLGLCFILMWIWFSIQGIFDTNIFDDKVSILFWILAGVNVAVYRIEKAKV
ncbi:MAG: O-antigen ligase family protein [Elusimicrobia bacterium]|nr:O-antigen ligase family protein [Elusimicrobiota bacterium]